MTVEIIIMNLILYFFIGIVIGIIDAWNKKVWFFIWGGILIIWILNAILYPSSLAKAFETFIWWQFLINLTLLVIGIYNGRYIYNQTFREKK